MPSPLSADHADDNVPTIVWLDYYAEHTPGVRPSLNASTLLGDFGEPQPDCSLRILPEHGGRTRIEDGFIAEGPELIVEIAKSSRRIDLGPKKADYESAGEQAARRIRADADRDAEVVRDTAQAAAVLTRKRADADADGIRNQAHATDREFYTFLQKLETYKQMLGKTSDMLLLSSKHPLFQLMLNPPGEKPAKP